MAKNFSINATYNDGCVSLYLWGDFDGISAFELLNYLKDQCPDCSSILVHTEGLEKIVPFGIEIWKDNLWMIAGELDRISFLGPRAFYLERKETPEEYEKFYSAKPVDFMETGDININS